MQHITPAVPIVPGQPPKTFREPQSRMARYVLSLIDLAGLKGITIKEMVKVHPQYTNSTISSRPSELERAGHIFYAGDKRDSSRVIRHIKYRDSL